MLYGGRGIAPTTRVAQAEAKSIPLRSGLSRPPRDLRTRKVMRRGALVEPKDSALHVVPIKYLILVGMNDIDLPDQRRFVELDELVTDQLEAPELLRVLRTFREIPLGDKQQDEVDAQRDLQRG